MKKYLKHIAIITFIPLFLCLWGCVEEVRIYPINISQNEVEFVNGNVYLSATLSSEGLGYIDAANITCGFYYSTKPNVTSEDKVCSPYKTYYETFDCSLKNLAESTTYYAKAFAINATGTIYGEEFSFTTPTPPRVKTLSVSEATTTSFNVEIELSSLGNTESSTVDYLGVLYSSTNSIPPYNSNYYVSASKMTKGKHTIEITDLKPNTTYWVRAYVKNSSSSGAYGEVLEIRTKSAPTVTSNELTIIDINSIKLSAKVTSSGTCNVTERGFCYGTTTNPNITSSMTLPCGTGLGTFEYVLSELILGTTYYIRPYAIDDEGSIVYGEEMVYKTLELPVVETGTINRLNLSSVICSSTITASENAVSVTERGICYSTSPEPTIDDNIVKNGSGLGSFSCKLTELVYGTTYYVRAYAKHEYGIIYGDEKSFELTEPKSNKLYFVNTPEWNTVYAYIWNDSGEYGSGLDAGVLSWPGEEATLEIGLNYNGYEIWSYDIFEYNVNYIIFNSGRSLEQTDDLEIDLSKPYYYNGKWYASLEDIGQGGSDANGYQYVDLGLSVKWATMNIGATSPEDYGNYYAWGETSPKSSYYSSNYYYSSNPATLPLNKDAANVNWGGDWRMPTKAEQDELRTKCTWTWTTVNGVKGCKVTSKQNGKSIFLPAAGFKDYSSTTDAGVYGDYWSSSRYSNDRSPLFNFNNVGTGERNFSRYMGLSVRAVLP
jgi:hypothetical protein